MRICLISARDDPGQEVARSCRRLAALLSSRHEVTLIHSAEEVELGSVSGSFRELVAKPSSALEGVMFASDDHRRSADVQEELKRAFGSEGPDYVEVCDRGAPGLVPLLARRGGDPLLREALFGVRLVGSAELTALHDGALGPPGADRSGDLEREQLRLADRVVWPGGDVLDLYRRWFAALPDAVCIREALEPDGDREEGPPSGCGPLRIVSTGPLQGHRGVLDLAEACLRLPLDDWRLTLLGADTSTAPAAQSVRLTIEAMFDGDPRLTIEDTPSPACRADRLLQHDVVAVTPTFAVWPEAALKAMSLGLPVLATPVGGLPELVEPGVGGWVAESTGARALGRELTWLVEDREEVRRMRASGAGRRRLAALADPEEILARYGALERELRQRRARTAGHRAPAPSPLVSGVVTYYRDSAHVEEAVHSLLNQTHAEIEVTIVNDGSFEPEDEVVSDLASDPRVRVVTQLNGGETSARNLGACMARGEYVVMLDADNALEPEFVARALAVFADEPELAYVSCWLRFVGPDGSPVSEPAGYAAVGNSAMSDDMENWDGDTLALIPRRVFAELGYGFDTAAVICSDWDLYRRLREDGHFGTAIPEQLARYRVLPDSLQRAHSGEMRERGWQEAIERRRLRGTRWTVEV
jgi:GT2 family glycosyltransferase